MISRCDDPVTGQDRQSVDVNDEKCRNSNGA